MEQKQNPQYFEGILQLRDPTKAIVAFVKEQIKARKGVFIAKTKKLKSGYDFYISSQRYLRSLGKMLQQKFPGELKQSRKLFSVSKSSGKPIYRVNVMFRPTHFRKGQIITFKEEKHMITNLSNRVQLKNISTGKRSLHSIDELKGVKLCK